MAQALEALWPADAPLSGLVVTRYGHVPPRPPGVVQRIEVGKSADRDHFHAEPGLGCDVIESAAVVAGDRRRAGLRSRLRLQVAQGQGLRTRRRR